MKTVSQLRLKMRKHKVLICVLSDLFLFLLCWIFATVIMTIYNSEVFPTNFFLWGLSEDAVKSGEGRVLIDFYVLGVFLCILIVTHFSLLSVISYFFIKANKAVMTNVDKNDKKLKWKKVVFWLMMMITFIGLPIITYFYLWKKEYWKENGTADIVAINPKSKQRFQYGSLAIGISLVLITNGVFIGLPTAIPLVIQTAAYYNPENVKKFYEFSNNHNNVLYLYFDRTDLWRVKSIIENDQGLKDQFKDFNFYTNNLSLSETTISSLPSMTLGWNADVLHKYLLKQPINEVQANSLLDNKTPVTFPGSHNVNVNDLNLGKYFEYSFANFIAFWNYLGYTTTNVCEFPFYGNESILLLRANNAKQMNDEMRDTYGFKGFTGVNANELQRYNGRTITDSNIDDAEIISHLPEELNFTKTDGNVFTALYSQQIHYDAVGKIAPGSKDYHVLHGNYPWNIEASIKDTFDDVVTLMNKLKEEQVFDKNNNPIPNDNVYNHTTVIITSDHGHCYDNEPTDPIKTDPNSMDRAAGYDPIFMIKPTAEANLIINPPAKSTYPNDSFIINNSLITNADHLALIRSYLYPNVKTGNQNTQQWANDALTDPLDPNYRYNYHSIDNLDPGIGNFQQWYYNFADKIDYSGNFMWDKRINKQLDVMRPIDWRFAWWRKDINPSKIRKFNYSDENKNKEIDKYGRTIFNPNYWSLVWEVNQG